MALTAFHSQSMSLLLTKNLDVGIPSILTVEDQCRAHWCWAAVALSVGKHFNVSQYQTQEDLVFNYLNLTTEERQANRSNCNFEDTHHKDCPNDEIPLRWLGFANAARKSGFIPEKDLIDELSNGYPVCAFIEWKNGMGYHATAIVGIDALRDNNNRIYIVSDPLHHELRFTYDQLCNSYYNIGQWKTTFTLF
jgi:hypothetical protein